MKIEDKILQLILLIPLKTNVAPQEIINKTCKKLNIQQETIKIISIKSPCIHQYVRAKLKN